jgi:hypothetical protein
MIAAFGASAKAGPIIAYEEDGSANFGTINPGTGVFSLIGNTETLFSGLGVDSSGKRHGGLNGGTTFEQVNKSTGALTAIGS